MRDHTGDDLFLGLVDGLELAGVGKESKGTVNLGVVSKKVVGGREEGGLLPGLVGWRRPGASNGWIPPEFGRTDTAKASLLAAVVTLEGLLEEGEGGGNGLATLRRAVLGTVVHLGPLVGNVSGSHGSRASVTAIECWGGGL